jgi:hypothetical protein
MGETSLNALVVLTLLLLYSDKTDTEPGETADS